MKKNSLTVMVFGTFDYLHLGHVHFLEYAKNLGNKLIIIIGRDNTVQQVKGKKTQKTHLQRKQLINNLAIADTVLLGHSTDRLARLKQLKPDVVCLGYDQRFFVDILKKYIRTHKLPTRIVRAPAFKPKHFKSSLMSQEAFIVRGLVQKGRGEGTQLGFPTANIGAPKASRSKIEPGIYASRVLIDNKEYLGATAVGVRMHNNAPLVEVHVLGIHKALYGKMVTAQLDHKLRNVRSYKTVLTLKKDINKDVIATKKFYKKQVLR